MEKKSRRQSYHSEKILGQLYDIVQPVKFIPTYDTPFDKRILDAYDLELETIQQASELKEEYDTRMKRIMAQHDVETEFEVWSSFVMTHNHEKSDYSFAEELGKIMLVVKDHHRKLCKEKVDEMEPNALSRLVAAMYTVTAREVAAAVEECNRTKMVGGEEVPMRVMDPKSMPLISFPWIFDRELGKIASGTFLSREGLKTERATHRQKRPNARPLSQAFNEDYTVNIETDNGAVPEGTVLKIFDETKSTSTFLDTESFRSGRKDEAAQKAVHETQSQFHVHAQNGDYETDPSNQSTLIGDSERSSISNRLSIINGSTPVQSSDEMNKSNSFNNTEIPTTSMSLVNTNESSPVHTANGIHESNGVDNYNGIGNAEFVSIRNRLRKLNGERQSRISRLEDYGVEQIHINLDDTASNPLVLLEQLVGAGDSSDCDSDSDGKNKNMVNYPD
jgi:hypothetical protein